MRLRRWIAAGLLCACSLAVQAVPVSFTDLAKHIQYKKLRISPDGEYYAATVVVKDHTALALIHRSDHKGHLVYPRDGDDVVDFWWASPSRVVYTVGTHVGGYDIPFSTGELFAVDGDSSNPILLYGYRNTGSSTGSMIQRDIPERGSAEFVAPIDDDPHHALVSISPWDAAGNEGSISTAYRMDLRDGHLAKIITAPLRNMSFVADHHGHIRFAYGQDVDGHVRTYFHAPNSDGWQSLPQDDESGAYPWAYSRDDSTVYFACTAKNGDGGICTWNPATRAMTPVWSNARVAPDGFVYGMASDDIVGVEFTDGRPGMALFDGHPDDAKALVALSRQLPGEMVRFVSGTADGSLSVVLAQADADPGTYYLYDRKSSKLTPLLARASWINPEQMAGKQPFEFAARDGLRLQGYVSYPPGKENAKHLPLVVYVHGGPYGVRDEWDYDPYVQALATHGYAVLQVNFRGSGGRGDAFEKTGWGEWGGKMQDDVTDATRWAIAQGIADPQHICIFGGSYGGYAALEGAVKEPDLYKCAIGYVGVYDLALMYHRGDIPQSTTGENYLKRVLGTDMAVLAQRSPINQLDRLKARVMLVVGGEDKRVPAEQGINLHNALSRRGIAHVWIDKPDEMHGFYNEANLAELFTAITQFLDSSIGGKPAAR